MCPTQIPEILDQQNAAKLILNEVKRGPVDCANNVVSAEADIFSLTSSFVRNGWVQVRYRAPNGANYNPPLNGQILKKKTLLRKEKNIKTQKNTETVEPTT